MIKNISLLTIVDISQRFMRTAWDNKHVTYSVPQAWDEYKHTSLHPLACILTRIKSNSCMISGLITQPCPNSNGGLINRIWM